jgi:lysophospholipase L1-like esterase
MVKARQPPQPTSSRTRAKTVRRILLLIACLALAAFFSLRFIYSSSWPRPMARPGWREGVERQHEWLLNAESPVLFLGDSIMEGWRFAGLQDWEREFAPLGALNLGVWGDRTEHLLWRLRRLPLERAQPRAVVVLIGANNLGSRRRGNTVAGIEAVVRELRHRLPETPILLHAVFPAGREHGPHRDRIEAVNRRLAQFAPEFGVEFLDIGERFLALDGQIPEEIMPDGLHLTPQGYALWAEALAPVLNSILEPAAGVGEGRAGPPSRLETEVEAGAGSGT